MTSCPPAAAAAAQYLPLHPGPMSIFHSFFVIGVTSDADNGVLGFLVGCSISCLLARVSLDEVGFSVLDVAVFVAVDDEEDDAGECFSC